MFKVKITFIVLLFVLKSDIYSQDWGSKEDFRENKSAKYLTWSLAQLVPSPSFHNETNGNDSRLHFGLKWNITPLNISLNPNKYVSPFQFFLIEPVRRFTGSAEIFLQPELNTSSFEYSDMSLFGLTSGLRFIMPLSDMGEALSMSLGGKYTFRKNSGPDENGYYGIEAGIYIFGGLLGFQYTKNFNENTKYNFNVYIKYF